MHFLSFPEIDIGAVRVNLARELQLWYGGRTVDHAGRGVISFSAIGGHLSRSSRWRALQRGDGVFWTLAGRKLFLFSAVRVARALDIRHVSAACRAPSAWLHERSRCRVCAQFFLGGLAVLRNHRPVAARTMAQLAGVSVRTVRTWQQRTLWGRIINVVLLEQIAKVGDGLHVNSRSLDGQVMRIELDDGVWLAARLPNSLKIRQQLIGKRAALRRVNARLTSHKGEAGQQPRHHVMLGQRRPHPPAQHTLYQFDSQLPPPEQIQVWLPVRSPKRRVQILKRFARSPAGDRGPLQRDDIAAGWWT